MGITLEQIENRERMNLPEFISGPVTYTHFNFQGIDLLIFGDYHHDNDGMCKACIHLRSDTNEPVLKNGNKNCYTLSAWIYTILNRLKWTNHFLDLYVETQISNFYNIKKKKFKLSHNYKKFHYDGRLGELERVYSDCETCDQLRYHFLDMRSIKLGNRTSDFTGKMVNYMIADVKSYISDFDNIENAQNVEYFEIVKKFLMDMHKCFYYVNTIIKEYTILCSMSINYPKELQFFVKKYISKFKNQHTFYFKNTMSCLFNDLLMTKSFYKQYDNYKVHLIGKQFRKLIKQQNEKGDITEKIKEMSYMIVNRKHTNDYTTEEYEFIIDDILNLKLSDYFQDFIFSQLTFPYLMDVYAIPRILYLHDQTSLKIYSAGDYHCDVLIQFINHFYPGNQLDRIDLSDMNRCLSFFPSNQVSQPEDSYLSKIGNKIRSFFE